MNANAHTVAAGGAGSLYDKLNNLHASLRKQKEDAYRTKQLAEERLRLARQDREGVERRANEAKAQLRELREKALEMKGKNEETEKENRHMEKEFNFQHAELQSKKEKLSRLEEKRAGEAAGRAASAAAAREMLRRLRDDSPKNGAPRKEPTFSYAGLPPDAKRRKLEHMAEADGGAGLCGRLPELLKMRRAGRREGIAAMERRNDSLRRIVAGYQNALGAGATEFPRQQNNTVLQQ